MTVQELINIISNGLKKLITPEDILSNEIELSYLKRIDKIFNKGLHFYLDPKTPDISKDASIFFRKSQFEADLNIGAKKIVNQFEEFKISLSAIAKLADLNIERKLPVYNITQNPRDVALEIREKLYPNFTSIAKDFLKSLIGKFAEYNILVFEFVETWNKKEKANIDGFFLNPNVIVLKRHQISFRREIFTLSHELAHFLRQVDNQFVNRAMRNRLTDIEYDVQKTRYLEDADIKQIILCLNLMKDDEEIILVTEETEVSNDNKLFKKIPGICRELNIKTMSLPELLVLYKNIYIAFTAALVDTNAT